MIIPDYASFREYFGQPDTTTATSISIGSQAITLATACDVEVGDYVMVDMGDPNYEIVTVESVTSTTVINATFTATHSGTTPIRILSRDGYRKWPLAKVRAGGFSNTLTAPTAATLRSILTPIVDGFDVYEDDGGTTGLPVHTWYVSQPGTYLDVTEKVDSNKTITLSFSTDARTQFNDGAAFTTPAVVDSMVLPMMKNVFVYCMDSSRNIQMVDLYKNVRSDV